MGEQRGFQDNLANCWRPGTLNSTEHEDEDEDEDSVRNMEVTRNTILETRGNTGQVIPRNHASSVHVI